MPTEQQIQSAIKAGYTPQQIKLAMARAGVKSGKKSLGGFAGNVLTSTARLVGDTAKAITNPIDTAKNIFNLGSGIIQLAIPGEQGNEKLARAVGNFYKNRYGSLDKAWNSFYSDPAGVAADLSTVLGVGAGTFKLLNAPKAAKALSKASKLSDPLNVASKLPKSAKGAGVVSKVGEKVEQFGKDFATRGLGTPTQLSKVEGVAGMPTYELINKYNLWDRSPESIQEAVNLAGKQSKTAVKTAIESGKTPDIRSIIKSFDDGIEKLSKESLTSDKAAAAAKELSRRKEMFIQSLAQNDNVPVLEKVRQIKSSFQSDIPESTFGMPTQDIGKSKGTTQAYRTLIGAIDETAGGTRQFGREQAGLLKLKKVAQMAEQRSKARQPLNFSRLGSAGLGGVLKGIPGAVGGFVAEQIANSPRGVEAITKGSIALGKQLQKPVKVSSKIPNTFRVGYEASRASRMLSPNLPSEISSPDHAVSSQNPLPKNQLPEKKQTSTELKAYPNYTKSSKLPKYNVFKNKASFRKVPRLKKLGG